MVMTALIALGLAMDAFAVALVSGSIAGRHHRARLIVLAASFAGFQAGLPLLGWLGAHTIAPLIHAIDYVIVFALLAAIGVKMIYESFQLQQAPPRRPLVAGTVLVLSLAVSIDALAVGMSFAFLQRPIVVPAIVFGLVTLVLSLLGGYLGRTLGHLLENRVQLAGGLLLIGIGMRVLLLRVF